MHARGASNSHMSYDMAHDDAPVSSDDRLLAREADDALRRHPRGRQVFFVGHELTENTAAALREGQPLYLLPDMNITRQESVFVPFYGVPTATLTSLARFASLGRARVVPVITRMTGSGYAVEVLPAWEGFPSGDLTADAATMNRLLQTYIDTMPTQYYWVHKRFKVRPPGEPPVYG